MAFHSMVYMKSIQTPCKGVTVTTFRCWHLNIFLWWLHYPWKLKTPTLRKRFNKEIGLRQHQLKEHFTPSTAWHSCWFKKKSFTSRKKKPWAIKKYKLNWLKHKAGKTQWIQNSKELPTKILSSGAKFYHSNVWLYTVIYCGNRRW